MRMRMRMIMGNNDVDLLVRVCVLLLRMHDGLTMMMRG